jgi:hypothetical protein
MPTDDYRQRESALSKLKDASLLIFLVTALSLTASVLYVWSLSGGLAIDLTRYLEIKDYLQITAHWLCTPVVIYAFWFCAYYAYRQEMAYYAARLKREHKAWLVWRRRISLLGWLCIILLWVLLFVGVIVINGAFIALTGLFAFVVPPLLWCATNSDTKGVIKLEPPFSPFIFRSLPVVYVSALLLGWYFEPFVIRNSPLSNIYLEGANSQPIPGRIVFGMTKYLMFLRASDGQFIAIASSKVQRIETLRGRTFVTDKPTPMPTSSANPVPTAMPLPKSCPTANSDH